MRCVEKVGERDRPAPAAGSLQRLFRTRDSCHATGPDPLPRPAIVRMLGKAQGRASWSNVEPWRTIVTSGPETDRFRPGRAGLGEVVAWRG